MELIERLRRSLGESYIVERELGGGGMARVFVAEERALGRKVVVKVLSPELAAEVSSERFAREIRLAAALQQANIVPLLSAGDAGGVPYYTMPFVEGQSLRHRLATGPLPIPFVANVLRDVARALAYAHERGVIHRDIKPDNVLLSGDSAVVTDFGIAKALAAALPASGATLTSAGVMIGTPSYMAPEQALGDPGTDHRADLYAFGCMAYELLTGSPPFTGPSIQRIVAGHMSDTAPSVAAKRTNVPANIAAVVDRCLRKDPDERPQSAREILDMLDTVEAPAAVALSPASTGKRTWRSYALGVAGLAAVAIALLAMPKRSTAPRTLAVMPFTNIGGDSTQEYFSEGIAVDLTTALSKVPGLQVTARSLAFTFKGRSVDARTVGRELGVDALLEATVQRFNDRLRVTAQLTRTADGVALWSNTYERDSRDVFGVQDAIATSIVNELRPTLAGRPDSARGANVAGTTNFEAYNSYLRGVYLLEHRGQGVATSISFFKDAIAKDSLFARAYGKLAEALQLLIYFSGTPLSAVQQQSIDAARTALRLDSASASGHLGLALAYDHVFRWDDAEREYLAAIRLEPEDATARVQYGRHLMYRARLDEAMVQYRRATVADPLNGTAWAWVGHVHSLQGRHDSAIAAGRKAREADPGLLLARTMSATDAIAAGDTALAISLASNIEGPPAWRGQAAFVLASAGQTATARRIVRELERLPPDTWLIHTALVMASLGFPDTTRALRELEEAQRRGEIIPKWTSFSDYMYDPLRGSARFAAMVRAFNLDARIATSPGGGRPR